MAIIQPESSISAFVAAEQASAAGQDLNAGSMQEITQTPQANSPSMDAFLAAEQSNGVTVQDSGSVSGTYMSANGDITDVAPGGLSSMSDINFSSTNARSFASGLPPGGEWGTVMNTPTTSFNAVDSSGMPAPTDWRVRVSLAPASTVFYNDGSNTIMSPLVETDGVIFPYTPSITIVHTATYASTQLTHSNYTPHFFQNGDVSDITITGDFTVQCQGDGHYLMAAIYFFRAATKMFFGDQAKNQGFAGNPPPMVFLHGYGPEYFPNVPCVVTSFSQVMSPDVDYIPVTSIDGSTVNRLPTSTAVTLTLKPVYSRSNIYNNFGLSDFAAGRLLGTSISGGFL